MKTKKQYQIKMKTKKQYQSIKQASEQMGISVKHLRIVKNMFPEGWNRNNSLDVAAVAKFYEDNKEEIIGKENDSIEALKKQKLSNDITLQDLQIAEAKKQTINVSEVKEFLKVFGLELGLVLNSKIVKELSSKLSDPKADSLCKETYNSIVVTIKKRLEDWQK